MSRTYTISRTPIERLMCRITRTDKGCWVFTGSRNRDGYGFFSIKHKTGMAHRFSYEHFVGPIPEGLLVCHKCDNPPCVNPDHLFLGTMKDNIADMWAKGRAKITGGKRRRGKGNSKLSHEQVLEIRSSNLSTVALAAKFGVMRTTISMVKNRHNWAWL